uniref:Uncharacterized protein n=1 Tax=Arion vulgaris TaxID=1028688 RepID=A0A0B7AIZ9_9EUPU
MNRCRNIMPGAIVKYNVKVAFQSPERHSLPSVWLVEACIKNLSLSASKCIMESWAHALNVTAIMSIETVLRTRL